MTDGHTASRGYRLFQKGATGVGVLTAAIGGVLLYATRESDESGHKVGWGLLVIGGTLLIHGLVALAVIRHGDRKAGSPD